jgi:transaldolase/glucose-6-phosphate isomerase
VTEVRMNVAAIEAERDRALKLLTRENAAARLIQHDASLWSPHPEVQGQVSSSLGWLEVPTTMTPLWPDLVAFRREVARDGYTHAVLLGMGGSSLISVLWTTVFSPGPEALTLKVLDSTDPVAVRTLAESLPLAHTIFLVASKSGTTTEPDNFARYYWGVLNRAGISPAPHFAAITDPGTVLADQANREHWRHVFLNPSDIGGRYSALSLFGLVPAALMDLDGSALLASALAMREQIAGTAGPDNPAVALAAVLGGGVAAGRDKATLHGSPRLSAVTLWLEQLLAESTGKNGTGVVPVSETVLGSPQEYGADRILFTLTMADEPDDLAAAKLSHLPRVTFTVESLADLGGEFMRWEAATALTGRVLGINPFDQPNVQESKDNTREMLAARAAHGGRLPEVEDVPRLGVESPALAPLLRAWLDDARPGEYLAVMAYLPERDDLAPRFAALQAALRARTGLAVAVSYGPRFLHSTGQLHKGGPAKGRFLQLVAPGERTPEVPVPGLDYSFNVLIAAQAQGDLRALADRGRPVLCINVGGDPELGLDDLIKVITVPPRDD